MLAQLQSFISPRSAYLLCVTRRDTLHTLLLFRLFSQELCLRPVNLSSFLCSLRLDLCLDLNHTTTRL
eukprot:COSAG01_NODE_17879_length_1117_cov_1.065815_2_plen_68_part_00